MRFSAVQEDGFGVGLGQETLPTDVDESMMAATGGVEPGGGNHIEEGSMISNLPLLFANGYPTSLEKITLPELERFITFMVQCSLGHDTAEEIRQPQWWPKEIKFSIPLVRPKKINDSYTSNLKKLVFRCYTYHRSEYLLRFCSYLAQYPHDKLEYVNNWDSTTSLYLKTTGKLLVTFRNENMNYDRKIEGSRRMLLQSNKPKTDYQNGTKCLRRRSVQKQAPSPAMVEPPIEDIYLCDNCDAEFIGLNKMKEHEKLCYRVEPRPLTPDVEEVPEIKQDQFMDYFKLKSTKPCQSNGATRPLAFSDNSLQNRTSGRIRGSVNLTRCPTIPFSSPAGLALGKKSKMMTELIQQERLERIERHLTAPALTSSYLKPKWLSKIYEFDRWSVTFKPNRDKTTKPDEYVHTYKFGDYSGKPKLDLRSQLLYIACKPIYVALERLTDEELEELKRNPSRYKTPEREVPRFRQRSPSIESIDESTPGDECNPIVIDLDDEDEPAPTPAPQIVIEQPRPLLCPTPVNASQRIQRYSWNLSSVAGMTKVGPVQPNNHLVTRASDRPPGPKRSKSLPATKPVIYVDLCSSDEESMEVEEVDVCTSADENCDPMQKHASATDEVRVDSAFIRNSLLGPSKFCAKPCIYPADSTSGWLSNLNVDGEPRRDSFLKHNSVISGTP